MGSHNFSQCCRLCLTDKVESAKSIFDDAAEDRALSQKISASLSIEICAEDRLSTIVCDPCMKKVDDWYAYKKRCCSNQLKLEQWLQQSTSSDLHHMSIQIKEEPVEVVDVSGEIVTNGASSVPVKTETSVDEEFNDLPPPLTPQAGNDDVDHEEISAPSATPSPKPGYKRRRRTFFDDTGNRCKICDKSFSRAANRRKHELTIHGINPGKISSASLGNENQEKSRSNANSQSLVEASSSTTRPSNNDQQKILFAAGLKLLQKKSSPPISQEPISKIEISYVAKCKAMASMYRTLVCACHKIQHNSVKGLLNHLRFLRIWFPSYTCYHCMTTFSNKSDSSKHYNRCRKGDLETLTQLSNLKRRTEVKTRLYQNYKCTDCGHMYSFHEDFCTHVDEVHCDVNLPIKCRCGRVFSKLEDYKDHAYISCLVEYYCDVCFVTVKTLDGFRKHGAENHDNSEGFALLQDDNYKRKRSSVNATPVAPPKAIKQEAEEDVGMARRRRRSTYRQPILEPAEEKLEAKVINPCVVPRVPGTCCPLCSRNYSSNNNMYRHYKTHFEEQETDDQEQDNSLYCCPDCGGMFTTAEWEKHKEKHKRKACHECGKVFQFQSELDQHRSVHLNLKVYRDSKTKAYKSTMVSPNGETNRVVSCDVCNTMFTSIRQLEEHKRTHEQVAQGPGSGQTLRTFTCRICFVPFFGYHALYEHRKVAHPEALVRIKKDFPMKCPHCDLIITSAGIFYTHNLKHLRQNAKEAKVIADYVPEEQSPEDDFNDNDESESYHTCKRCFKVFSTKVGLRGHMKSHGGKRPSPSKPVKSKNIKKIWCETCHLSFDNNEQLQQHKDEEHYSDDQMPELTDEREHDIKAPYVFTCNVCVKTFTSKGSLKRHKIKHAEEKAGILKAAGMKQTLVFCKHCKVSFTSTQKLDEHMKEEHMEKKESPKNKGNKDGKTTCKICRKVCKSVFSMYAHIGWHKRISNRKMKENEINESEEEQAPPPTPKVEPKAPREEFRCGKCRAVLPNNTALQIHILEKHRNVNAIALLARCSSCKLDFSSQQEYEQHKHLHSLVESPKKNYSCKSCPAAFGKQETLNTHVKQFHRPSPVVVTQNEFRCHQCDRVFDKQSSLSIHLKVHEKQKLINGGGGGSVGNVGNVGNAGGNNKTLYSCSICNAGFNLPKDLRTHTIQAHPF